MEHFLSTLGHLGLQCQLLAVGAPTLEAAVWDGNEYFQIAPKYPGKSHPQMAVRTWEEEGEADTPEWGRPTEAIVGALTRRVQQLEGVPKPKRGGRWPG